MPPTDVDVPPDTPVRGVAAVETDGVRLLSDSASTYRDGAEDAVLELLRGAKDVSALSEELVGLPVGWAQTYHLTPARANVLRALSLPPGARVLEVGAGCGAVTRYLGETCALVDAVEPVLERAVVARERCRDLPGVEIFAGELADVPAQPAYDIAVIVGVLEYVGHGSSAREPYLAFLAEVRRRLLPGGALVLAIENRLGVKYLAGAPEDHTDRSFDSLEGYPHGGPARTFTRRELTSLLEDSGHAVMRTLGTFPDYKLARAVIDQGLADLDESLLHRIPRFPSPDWASPRPKLAVEQLLWRTLVDDGRPVEFANSFLVLAGDGATELWPAGQLASWLATDRRPQLLVQARLTRDATGAGATVSRRLLRPGDGGRSADIELPPTEDGRTRTMWNNESDEPYQPGVDLTQVLERASATERADLLRRWVELIDDGSDEVPMDLVPHNLVVTPGGELAAIDAEWTGRGWRREDVLGRGVFHLTATLVATRSAQDWPGCSTVGAVATMLGEECGLAPGWLPRSLELESLVQAAVRGEPAADCRSRLEAQLDQPLATLPLGVRTPELLISAQRERDSETAMVRDRDEQIATLTADLRRAGEAHAAGQQRLAYAEMLLAQSTVERLIQAGRGAARRGLAAGRRLRR